MMNLDDTIAAIATARGPAGIAVVKISGPQARSAALAIFRAKNNRKLAPRQMVFGTLVDDAGAPFDEALVCYMPGPASYTRQDVVEIQTHGGAAAASTVLDLLADRGVRMAGPGEFTQRAFLLGRIDLAQAEAVSDLIQAQTRAALVAAKRQLSGALSGKIHALRQQLIEGKALLEANIDFPDEEIGELEESRLLEILTDVEGLLAELLKTYATGRLYREGAVCVIAGRPNVGKSSLLNALLRKKRAIVNATPGTTRDAIEAAANIDGVPFRIVDTAGIRHAEDPIEDEGVKVSREQIANADLVIFLVDASQDLTESDREIFHELQGRSSLSAINKIDLLQSPEDLPPGIAALPNAISISAKTGLGLDELRDAMVRIVRGGGVPSADQALLTNARHRQAVELGRERLLHAINAVTNRTSPEWIALELDEAFTALGEVVGEATPDDVLNLIFSTFCIGK